MARAMGLTDIISNSPVLGAVIDDFEMSEKPHCLYKKPDIVYNPAAFEDSGPFGKAEYKTYREQWLTC